MVCLLLAGFLASFVVSSAMLTRKLSFGVQVSSDHGAITRKEPRSVQTVAFTQNRRKYRLRAYVTLRFLPLTVMASRVRPELDLHRPADAACPTILNGSLPRRAGREAKSVRHLNR
jgi:hypothetical protein